MDRSLAFVIVLLCCYGLDSGLEKWVSQLLLLIAERKQEENRRILGKG